MITASVMKELKRFLIQLSMIHQVDSKWMAAFFNKCYDKMLNKKTLLLRGFILKPTERPYFPLKSATKDFWNSPVFKRSACFYAIITIVNAINPLSANCKKWSDILKQFACKLPTNCLIEFYHFVGLALKGLRKIDLIQFDLNLIMEILEKLIRV